MRRKKIVVEEKRFSLIPRKIRNLFTKRLNTICKEERVPSEEIEIVIVDALIQAEEIKKEAQKTSWKTIWGRIQNKAKGHATILTSMQREPDF